MAPPIKFENNNPQQMEASYQEVVSNPARRWPTVDIEDPIAIALHIYMAQNKCSRSEAAKAIAIGIVTATDIIQNMTRK